MKNQQLRELVSFLTRTLEEKATNYISNIPVKYIRKISEFSDKLKEKDSDKKMLTKNVCENLAIAHKYKMLTNKGKKEQKIMSKKYDYTHTHICTYMHTYTH